MHMWTRTVVLAIALGIFGLVAQPTPAKAGFFDSFGLALSHLGQMTSLHGTSGQAGGEPVRTRQFQRDRRCCDTAAGGRATAADTVPVPLVAATDLAARRPPVIGNPGSVGEGFAAALGQ